jgi:hypothetical protein
LAPAGGFVMVVQPEAKRSSMWYAGAFVLAVLFASPALLVGPAWATGPGASPGPWCGGELWRLETLSDRQRARVDFHKVETSIAQIAKLPPPRAIGRSRATDFQRRRWSMRVVVDRYRIASNGEILLVLYSIDSAQYMDAYLPNPHCLGPRARDRTGIDAARREFTSHCPPATAAWQLLGATVELAGIGFWNPSKSTRGALPNGAELRPLTNLKLVTGCGAGF